MLDGVIRNYYLKYMAIIRKYFLPLLIIILLFSCKKRDNNAGTAENTEEYISEQTKSRESIIEQRKMDEIEFDKKMNRNGTIAAEIAVDFAKRIYFNNPPWYSSSSNTGNVSEIEAIIPVQGYYIQQSEEQYKNGRTPEILALSVNDKNIYIKEIDMVKGKIVTRKEILLKFDGKTFAHNRTKLETQDGKIQIVYLENAPEETWRGPFEYDIPYTFAGNLKEPINDNVRKLTSDYLETFTGFYFIDSCKLIESSSEYFSFYPMRNAYLNIVYNQELKCLTICFSISLYDNYTAQEFVETDDGRIIYWIAGEAAGYTDIRFYFYKGGIAYTYDKNEPDYSSLDEDDYPTKTRYDKYVVFFRKEK